jgi:hypothetical protein
MICRRRPRLEGGTCLLCVSTARRSKRLAGAVAVPLQTGYAMPWKPCEEKSKVHKPETIQSATRSRWPLTRFNFSLKWTVDCRSK